MALSAAAPAMACYYTNPNDQTIGVLASEAELLTGPTADFRVELDRLPAPGGKPFLAVAPGDSPEKQTLAAEWTQLVEALAGRDAAEVSRLAEGYVAAREACFARALAMREAAEKGEGAEKGDAAATPALIAADAIPAGLPGEFDDYLRGVVAAANGDETAARAAWLGLLDRPANERRRRSVWAAFMLGKHPPDVDDAWAATWFGRVRSMVGDGADDPLGLGNSSYGWEAREALGRRDFARAISLYRLQQAGGDPTAVWSLRTAAGKALDSSDDAALGELAKNVEARDVVTAYLLARGGPLREAPKIERWTAWCSALETAGAGSAPGVDRLAWLAYGAGRMDLASRWAALAGDSPVALEVVAKLAMRDGRMDDAATAMEKAITAFGDKQRWSPVGLNDEPIDPADPARCDLALIRLSQERYSDALDLYLRCGHWADAAYLAERVLDADELQAHVDEAYPAPESFAAGLTMYPGDRGDSATRAQWIRHSLARRLSRRGRWAEARAYFPPEAQAVFDQFILDVRIGEDTGAPRADRAGHLMAAARAAVEQGPELFGVDEDYSWHTEGGHFWEFSAAHVRARAEKVCRLTPPSLDERERVAASERELPEPTWHYRYRASDLAWAAGLLMDDDDPALANLLGEAGDWLKHRDAPAADRFYKALVRRCPHTALGIEAKRARWFPKRK